MNVLVLGGAGLIGRELVLALRNSACSVIDADGFQPGSTNGGQRGECDFATMTSVRSWLPALEQVDVVVNCLGMLGEIPAPDFDVRHRETLCALFAACEQLGIERVVQVSALGSMIDVWREHRRRRDAVHGAPTGCRVRITIVHPSLVYAECGTISLRLLALASLPLVFIPMVNRPTVQPIHIDDLLAEEPVPFEIAAVGPRALTMANYIAQLRTALAAPTGLVCNLPLPLARIGARVAQACSVTAVAPPSWAMLAKTEDGAKPVDAGAVASLLGRPLRYRASFARPEQLAAAVLWWGMPLMRVVIALLWLITAVVSWFGWPHADSARWLVLCGVPSSLTEPVLLAASVLDGALGLALLLRPRRWLWPLQIALVAAYTMIMTMCLPVFWLHPYGPLSKNLPILAMMVIIWRLTPERD